jgi:branched-subunit amino acid aminotransferase/4-amino-4-deoxychorismate lyase
MGILRVEVDGAAATAETLTYPAVVNYGHFTAMQVRGGAVRGLDLHLARLDAATRELFDTGLAGERVREHVRHALAGDLLDATVRVTVFRPDDAAEPAVMVVVRPPVTPPAAAQRLTAVPYLRPAAHLKHVGGFGQIHYGLLADRAGFDDALLVGTDGLVSEGGITNIGFFDGTALVWPQAPSLAGITMQLLTRVAGVPVRRAPVYLADLPAFRCAFVTNSLGVAPVERVDDVVLPTDPDFVRDLGERYEAVPWDQI